MKNNSLFIEVFTMALFIYTILIKYSSQLHLISVITNIIFAIKIKPFLMPFLLWPLMSKKVSNRIPYCCSHFFMIKAGPKAITIVVIIIIVIILFMIIDSFENCINVVLWNFFHLHDINQIFFTLALNVIYVKIILVIKTKPFWTSILLWHLMSKKVSNRIPYYCSHYFMIKTRL